MRSRRGIINVQQNSRRQRGFVAGFPVICVPKVSSGRAEPLYTRLTTNSDAARAVLVNAMIVDNYRCDT